MYNIKCGVKRETGSGRLRKSPNFKLSGVNEALSTTCPSTVYLPGVGYLVVWYSRQQNRIDGKMRFSPELHPVAGDAVDLPPNYP